MGDGPRSATLMIVGEMGFRYLRFGKRAFGGASDGAAASAPASAPAAALARAE